MFKNITENENVTIGNTVLFTIHNKNNNEQHIMHLRTMKNVLQVSK